MANLIDRPSGRYDTLVVGAGFAGAVMAERLATQLDQRVLVIDRRPHIGGNAFDELDDAGVLVHRYGPHIFHTQSEKVFDYLSRFTEWRPYEHRVRAVVGDRSVTMPICRTTVNELTGLSLSTEAEMAAYLEGCAEPVGEVRTSEDAVVSKVGRTLYEQLFRGYTRKQWRRDPSELDASVCGRLPVRLNEDDRYFTDRFQQMPLAGYTALFERLLAHPGIEVALSTDSAEVIGAVEHDHLVYTGPIDGFFGYRFGHLPYRSLRWELHSEPTPDRSLLQPVGSMNYADETVPYTRITEYRHLTGQVHDRTTLAVEYPCSEGDPYYPIPTVESGELYKRYRALAAEQSDVTFVGRLARYQYLNIDQVVGQALATFQRHADRSSIAA